MSYRPDGRDRARHDQNVQPARHSRRRSHRDRHGGRGSRESARGGHRKHLEPGRLRPRHGSRPAPDRRGDARPEPAACRLQPDDPGASRGRLGGRARPVGSRAGGCIRARREGYRERSDPSRVRRRDVTCEPVGTWPPYPQRYYWGEVEVVSGRRGRVAGPGEPAAIAGARDRRRVRGGA